MGIGSQQESQRDVAEGDSGKGGEQGGPREPTSQAVSTEGSHDFDQSRSHAGHHPRMPRAADGLSLWHPAIEGRQLDRKHDEKDVRKQAHGVDAVGQGGAVITAFAGCQLPGQTCVRQIPNQETHARSRQNLAKQQRIRIAKNTAAQADDQQDLNQVVEPQG